jgi:hypothetical protein
MSSIGIGRLGRNNTDFCQHSSQLQKGGQVGLRRWAINFVNSTRPYRFKKKILKYLF